MIPSRFYVFEKLSHIYSISLFSRKRIRVHCKMFPIKVVPAVPTHEPGPASQDARRVRLRVLQHHASSSGPPRPSALSATALQDTSIVLLPPVNHPSLENQYHLVRLCSVIAIMAGHQGFRTAGAAEVFNALPTILRTHPHVKKIPVAGR